MIIDTVKVTYDTLHPDQKLTDFLAFCREVKMRYEGNAREAEDKEAQLQDLEHYAELYKDLDIQRGFALYAKIRDTRRARRSLKSENELLYPVYAWILANEDALNGMAGVLGSVRKAEEAINSRKYMTRTNVLDGKA